MHAVRTMSRWRDRSRSWPLSARVGSWTIGVRQVRSRRAGVSAAKPAVSPASFAQTARVAVDSRSSAALSDYT